MDASRIGPQSYQNGACANDDGLYITRVGDKRFEVRPLATGECALCIVNGTPGSSPCVVFDDRPAALQAWFRAVADEMNLQWERRSICPPRLVRNV